MFLVAFLAGCGGGKPSDKAKSGDDAADSSTSVRAAEVPRRGTLTPAVVPLAKTGGVCGKLSYELIQSHTGLRFNVAALHRTKSEGGSGVNVESCTVRSAGDSIPDLTMTLAPGKLDNKAFEENFRPKEATKVDGLGKGAYRYPHQSAGNAAVEIGWFTDSGSYTLVVNLKANTSTKNVDAMAEKLVSLAKAVK